MPALQVAGIAMPVYAAYIARLQSLAASASAYNMNFGMAANSPLQQQLLANANWPYGLAGRYGMQSSGWPFGNNNTNQFPGVPKDWRNGDWLCSCGFHNYSSRTQVIICKSDSFDIIVSLSYCHLFGSCPLNFDVLLFLLFL